MPPSSSPPLPFECSPRQLPPSSTTMMTRFVPAHRHSGFGEPRERRLVFGDPSQRPYPDPPQRSYTDLSPRAYAGDSNRPYSSFDDPLAGFRSFSQSPPRIGASQTSALDAPDGDVVLEAIDGVQFRVHSANLRIHFDGFGHVLDGPEHVYDPEAPIRMAVPSAPLRTILRLCYPSLCKDIFDLGVHACVDAAATAYFCHAPLALEIVRRQLHEWISKFVEKNPAELLAQNEYTRVACLRIFNFAFQHRLEESELCNAAAAALCGLDPRGPKPHDLLSDDAWRILAGFIEERIAVNTRLIHVELPRKLESLKDCDTCGSVWFRSTSSHFLKRPAFAYVPAPRDLATSAKCGHKPWTATVAWLKVAHKDWLPTDVFNPRTSKIWTQPKVEPAKEDKEENNSPKNKNQKQKSGKKEKDDEKENDKSDDTGGWGIM